MILKNQQLEIDASLKELRKRRKKVAQEKKSTNTNSVYGVSSGMLKKQRLPGLSADYLEFFYVATDRIEDLSRALNKMRINMDEINRLCDLCEDDLELLDKKTKRFSQCSSSDRTNDAICKPLSSYSRDHPSGFR